MQNQAMQRKLTSRECLDVRALGEEIEPGLYRLDHFIEDVDYADAETETWVWSVGKSKDDGKIYAATDTRFYQNPAYECLWLR